MGHHRLELRRTGLPPQVNRSTKAQRVKAVQKLLKLGLMIARELHSKRKTITKMPLPMNSFSLRWARLSSSTTTEMSFRHRKNSTQKVFKPHTRLIGRRDVLLLNIHTATKTAPAALVVGMNRPQLWDMVPISHHCRGPTGQPALTPPITTIKSQCPRLTFLLPHHIILKHSLHSTISITTIHQAIWTFLITCRLTPTQDTIHHRLMLSLLIHLFLPPRPISGTILTRLTIYSLITTHTTLRLCHVYKLQSGPIQTLKLIKLRKFEKNHIKGDHIN